MVHIETSSGQNGPKTTKNGTFQPPRWISRYSCFTCKIFQKECELNRMRMCVFKISVVNPWRLRPSRTGLFQSQISSGRAGLGRFGLTLFQAWPNWAVPVQDLQKVTEATWAQIGVIWGPTILKHDYAILSSTQVVSILSVVSCFWATENKTSRRRRLKSFPVRSGLRIIIMCKSFFRKKRRLAHL